MVASVLREEVGMTHRAPLEAKSVWTVSAELSSRLYLAVFWFVFQD